MFVGRIKLEIALQANSCVLIYYFISQISSFYLHSVKLQQCENMLDMNMFQEILIKCRENYII